MNSVAHRTRLTAVASLLTAAPLAASYGNWDEELPSRPLVPTAEPLHTRAAISPGDLDGDGVPDVVWIQGLAAGFDPETPEAGPLLVRVHSGATGEEIDSLDAYPGAWGLQPMTDETGDGVPEFLAFFPLLDVDGAVDRGAARVFDGATRSVLRAFSPPAERTTWGSTFIRIADRTGDGIAEFILSAYNPDITERWDIISGATGESLLQLEIPDSDGAAITALEMPDLTGDGVADLLVTFVPGIRVIDGATGRTAAQFQPPAGGAGTYGRFMIEVPDEDADGKADFVTLLPGPEDWFGVFSSASGGLIRTLDNPAGIDMANSRSVVQGVDYNGDGVRDVLLASEPGVLLFFDGATFEVRTLNYDVSAGSSGNSTVSVAPYRNETGSYGFIAHVVGIAPVMLPHIVPSVSVLTSILAGSESDPPGTSRLAFPLTPVGETRRAHAVLTAYGVSPVTFAGASASASPEFTISAAPAVGTLIMPGDRLSVEITHLGTSEGMTSGVLLLEGAGVPAARLALRAEAALRRPPTANEITFVTPGAAPGPSALGTPGLAYAAQPSLGVTRVVGGSGWGSGSGFDRLTDAALLGGGRLLLAPMGSPASLLTVDRTTFEVSAFGPPFADEPAVTAVRSLSSYGDAQALLLGDAAGGPALFRIDATTGARTVLSGPTVGAGTALTSSGLGVHALGAVPGGPIFVRQGLGLYRLLRIDPQTGDRTVVHSEFSGDVPGNPFATPSGAIVADAGGTVYAWAPQQPIWRFEPGDGGGAFAPFSGAGAGSGVGEGLFDHVAVSRNGVRMVAIESSLDELVWIDPGTGERRLVDHPRPLLGPMPPLDSGTPWVAILFDVPGSGLLMY